VEPAILLFCFIGADRACRKAVPRDAGRVFGVLGYIFVRLGCEGAPFLFGTSPSAPRWRNIFRRAMLRSRGDTMVFIREGRLRIGPIEAPTARM